MHASSRRGRAIACVGLALATTACVTQQAPSVVPAQPAGTTVATSASVPQPSATAAPVIAAAPTPAAGSAAPAAPGVAASAQPAQAAEVSYRFASGRVERIDGHTLRIDGPTQTLVSWNDRTSFTTLVKAAASDLAVGRCVQVRPGWLGEWDGSPPAMVARAVTISEPVGGGCPRADGDCLVGFGEGWRGLVTAISGASITVELRQCAPAGAGKPPSVTRTFTVSAATTWQRLAGAGADAVQVGQCATVVARPSADPTLTAVSISLRPGDGPCAVGIGAYGWDPEDSGGADPGWSGSTGTSADDSPTRPVTGV